jgi:ABC-type multidrug transport system fused ATPase/permease subunit
MFNKKSNHSSKLTSRIENIKKIKLLRDPNFTKISVFTLSICLIIYLILPLQTQIFIKQILQHPIILSLVLSICLLVGFINTSVSISLLIFLAVLYFYKSIVVEPNIILLNNGNTMEGFKSNKSLDVESGEEEISNTIKDLFAGGPLVKSFNEGRKTLNEMKAKEKAEENMLILETKNSKTKNKEKFSNSSSNNRENFKPIPQRKFNPADKEDTDLLLVMDHCKDISNRIKYEYEDTRYLKKYIKDKLEDIIDTLDLVEQD